jgi:CHRD domain-containing protein
MRRAYGGLTMKRVAAICGIAIGLAACGSNATAPTNQPTVFTVQLRAANEVPPVTNADVNGTGTAVITITTTKDASGNVTSGTINFNVSMSGFPADTSAIAAHIHGPGATTSTTANVFVDTGLTAGTAIQMPNGTGSFNLTAPAATVDQINQILANPAGFYFNVHTALNRGGAIRGQLK